MGYPLFLLCPPPFSPNHYFLAIYKPTLSLIFTDHNYPSFSSTYIQPLSLILSSSCYLLKLIYLAYISMAFANQMVPSSCPLFGVPSRSFVSSVSVFKPIFSCNFQTLYIYSITWFLCSILLFLASLWHFHWSVIYLCSLLRSVYLYPRSMSFTNQPLFLCSTIPCPLLCFTPFPLLVLPPPAPFSLPTLHIICYNLHLI